MSRPTTTASGSTASSSSVLADHSRSQIQKLIADGHVDVAAAARSAWPASPAAEAEPARARRRSGRRSTLPDAAPSAVDGRSAAARDPLPGRRPGRAEQAGRHGGASRRRPRLGHAGERAAPPPHRSERHRRRAAAGHRAPARSRHVGRDGGRQERRARIRSCRASSTIARSRRNTSRSSGAWCRPAAASTRRSAATRPTGRRCRRAAKHAREAVTRITRAHHLPGLTLCQVAIHTGRTHQIRVHLSAIGHPIVGDSLYGGVHRRVAGRHPRGAAARASVPARRAAGVHASARAAAHGVHRAAARGPERRPRRPSRLAS